MANNQPIKHIVFLRNPEEDPAWGGLEKLMLEWFERINYKDFKITLCISKKWVDLFNDKLKEKNIPVNIIELPFEPKKDFYFKRFIHLLFFLKGLKPSTIVFMQGWFFSFNVTDVLAGFMICPGRIFMHENLGPPKPSPKKSNRYFGFIRGVGFWWYVQICKAQFRAYLSNKVLVVSKEIQHNLVSLWHYPPEKVIVQSPGINLNEFHSSLEIRAQMRDNLKIPPEETVIIIASRLSPVKCIDRTIGAFNLLSSSFPNITLIVIGSGPLEDDLKNLANSLPCSNKIKFLGQVENVANYFKMSDIYVLSSDNEGFGIALIEAMATGLICVATKCPGPNEIVQDGVNGFLVDKNIDAVREGLYNALKLSADQKNQMQKNAIRLVSENYEMNARIKDVFDVLGIDGLEGK